MIDWENLSTGLTLPEAIRKGAEGLEKCTGDLFKYTESGNLTVCALGAAIVGIVGRQEAEAYYEGHKWGKYNPGAMLMWLDDLYGEELVSLTWKANDGPWRHDSLEVIADRIEAGELTEWVIADFPA